MPFQHKWDNPYEWDWDYGAIAACPSKEILRRFIPLAVAETIALFLTSGAVVTNDEREVIGKWWRKLEASSGTT